MDTTSARRPATPGVLTVDTTLAEVARMVTDPDPDPEPYGDGRVVVEIDQHDTDLDCQARLDIAAAARARRAPYLATAATAVTGYAAWGAAELAAAVGPAGAHGAAVTATCAATALTLPVLRRVFGHAIPEAWRTRWWLAGACAAGWVDVTAAAGGSWVGLGALVVGSALLSARWAADHEVPHPGDLAPAPEPAPQPRPALDHSRAATLEQAFYARVAGGGSPIAAGARPTDRTELPNGTQWVIELDPDGPIGCTRFIERTDDVALKLGVKPSHVILDRLEGGEDREDRALLTVVTRDVLAGGVAYEGPRYDRGRVPIGRYADGSGEAGWVAYDDTGVLPGLVAGGQGSGKSALMSALAMAYRASGEWIVLFGDGDDQGNSSPLLKQVAYDFAKGPDEVGQQLEALESWYRVRGAFMPSLTWGSDGTPTPMTDPASQQPVDKIMPCPTYPGHVWILDEFHRLARNPTLKAAGFVGRVAQLLRIMRKYGGTIIVGTQSLLGEDFAGDTAFRGMLAQGNLIALRSKNKSERYVVSDFGFAPSTLPKGGGYGFSDDGVRRAMLRVAWSTDMDRWTAGLPDTQPDRRSALAYAQHRCPRRLDPVVDFQQTQQRLAELDAALASGTPLRGSTQAPDTEPARPTSVGGVPIPQAPPRGNVYPFRPRTEAAEPTPQQPAETGPLPAKAAQVLAVLRSRPGPWRTAELADSTELAKPDVSKALGELVRRGLAHRPTAVQGVHAAGPAPAEVS